MADELESTQLTVILLPAKRGEKMVRAVESENPAWYRRLCAQHTSIRRDGMRWRKHKTSIKRRETVIALRAIGVGRRQKAKHFGAPLYRRWLLPIIKAEIAADKREREAIRREQEVPF